MEVNRGTKKGSPGPLAIVGARARSAARTWPGPQPIIGSYYWLGLEFGSPGVWYWKADGSGIPEILPRME